MRDFVPCGRIVQRAYYTLLIAENHQLITKLNYKNRIVYHRHSILLVFSALYNRVVADSTVGHLPKKISKATSFSLLRGGGFLC